MAKALKRATGCVSAVEMLSRHCRCYPHSAGVRNGIILLPLLQFAYSLLTKIEFFHCDHDDKIRIAGSRGGTHIAPLFICISVN